jgi:UDP-N-acetylglucosamine diphosphorylase/glucosamine-1-phosphate N-acetyltransferase
MQRLGVIILAAGKGTRMKSEKPKVCFQLAGKSLIQRVVDTSLMINADLVGVVVGFKKEMVMEDIIPHPNIRFVTQANQKGTGDAVGSARDLFSDFEGIVFVLCGDVPLLSHQTLDTMLSVHTTSRATCTVLTTILTDPDRYGRMVRDTDGRIQKIVEYKDASPDIRKINEINTGIYCFDSSSLFDALVQIDDKNEQGEYYLTDVLEIFYNQGKKIESVVLADISEVAGINSHSQLASLESEHYAKIRQHFMDSGVSIENPATVLIQDDVVIESDVYISANAKISGKTVIRANSYIGPSSIVIDSTLATGSHLEGFNVVKNMKEQKITLKWYESITDKET